MKIFFQSIAIAIVTLGLLFWFVANYSVIESSYECVGKFSHSTRDSTTIYLRLSEYRFWVRLWSDSDASLFTEVPNNYVDYYSHLEEVANQFQIYQYDRFKGNFSTLSNTLALDTPGGFFDGNCRKLQD